MINVELESAMPDNLPAQISFAAKSCYQAEKPKKGELINIENGLFNPGHHTTLQHAHFTFFIEGIAVSDITLGLHLANPFYDSSQRSGRFCGQMFASPDYDVIRKYITTYWPQLSPDSLSKAIDFVKNSIVIYQRNFDNAVNIAKQFIREERPFANDKYIEQNAPKFAQEQLRMFIPTIFPTAVTYTLNLSALVAMYRAAWSSVLRVVTQKMADIVLKFYPEFGYMFTRSAETDKVDNFVGWMPELQGLLTKPSLYAVSLGDAEKFIAPQPEDMHPVDLLRFKPEYMENNVEEIKTDIEISLATMGQDQRHRTVGRGKTIFTGDFYLPPILRSLGLEDEARQTLNEWFGLSKSDFPMTLIYSLAPYGAVVSYQKSASYNAAAHEMSKRLCWCAQEEIFHLALKLRSEVIQKDGERSPLLLMFMPPCVRTGKCGEGKRYCGRDLKKDCFIERKI